MSISVTKVVAVELPLDKYSKLNIAKVFEQDFVSDRFKQYKPVYTLVGYVDTNGLFHPVKRTTVHYIPQEGVRSVRFLLYTNQQDPNSDVACQIATYSLDKLQALQTESDARFENISQALKTNL